MMNGMPKLATKVGNLKEHKAKIKERPKKEGWQRSNSELERGGGGREEARIVWRIDTGDRQKGQDDERQLTKKAVTTQEPCFFPHTRLTKKKGENGTRKGMGLVAWAEGLHSKPHKEPLGWREVRRNKEMWMRGGGWKKRGCLQSLPAGVAIGTRVR